MQSLNKVNRKLLLKLTLNECVAQQKRNVLFMRYMHYKCAQVTILDKENNNL